MKMRVVLAVGVALAVGGLGACWYTGNTFDRIMAEQITKVQRESGVELTWIPGSQHLFSRDGVLKLVATPETLARLDSQLAGSGPIEAQLTLTSRIMPLHIKSRMLLDTKQGSLAPLFAALGMEQWQLGVESVCSLWSQSNSSRFWADEFKIKQGQDEFSFLPMSGDYHGDLEGNGQVGFSWQGITLHEAQSNLDLVLADLKGSADMAEIGGIWLSPRSNMTLSAFSMQLPDGLKIALQGVTTQSQLEGENAETLSSRYHIKVATLNLENEIDQLALTQSNLDLNLKGLDLEGYQALQEVSGQGVEDPAIQQALDKMLQRGATLELVDLSAHLNGEPVTVRGDLQLASTSLEQLSSSDKGMQALSGLIHANLSSELGKSVPQLAPMLEQFALMGYLKAEKNKLTAEFKLDKGTMTVNGLPL